MDGRNYRPKHVELIEITNKIIIFPSSRLFVFLYLGEICVNPSIKTVNTLRMEGFSSHSNTIFCDLNKYKITEMLTVK